jgi:uncharacterized integral membrane protein
MVFGAWRHPPRIQERRYDQGRPMSTTPHQAPVGGRTNENRKRSLRGRSRTGVVIALAALAITFGVLNTNEVKVDWIIGSGHAPLIIVIVISTLGGILITYLAERIIRRRR